MKTRAAFFSVLLVTLTLVFGFNAVGDEIHTGQTAHVYKVLLDQYIAKCDSKTEMKNSSLENIRRAAAIATLKGAFAKTYRKELVMDMIQDEISPKSYKVQLYLNDRFYNLIREKNSAL